MVIAPTAFKGTLTPGEAANAIADGIRRKAPRCPTRPRAHLRWRRWIPGVSGGAAQGRAALRGRPRSRPRPPRRALRRHTPGAGVGIVEAALAIGLARVPPAQLDALGATSGGLGEVLAEVRQAGAREILVGLGGSASTDGGTGMARALGYRFLDADGVELPEGGGYLHRLARIDASNFDPAWLMLSIRVACDVDNPLLGTSGSAATYGPQKGHPRSGRTAGGGSHAAGRGDPRGPRHRRLGPGLCRVRGWPGRGDGSLPRRAAGAGGGAGTGPGRT